MFNNKFLKNDPLLEAVKGAMQDGDLRRQAVALVNEHFGVYNRNAVVREHLADYDAAIDETFADLKEGVQIDELYGKGRLKDIKQARSKDTYKAWKKAEKASDVEHDERGYRTGPSREDKEYGKAKHREEKADMVAQKLKHHRKKMGFNEELAKKDYDKDGKIESPKDEVWGSRLRAAKMAGKMEEEKWEGSKEDNDEDKKLAKKHGMSLSKWEKSDADKKHDAHEKNEKKAHGKDLDEEIQIDEKTGHKTDRYVTTVSKGEEGGPKKMDAIKNAVRGYNKAKGTKVRVDRQGRLGKDNPEAKNYNVGGMGGKKNRARVHQDDAQRNDVYLRNREGGDYKSNKEHIRRIKHGIANKFKKAMEENYEIDESSLNHTPRYPQVDKVSANKVKGHPLPSENRHPNKGAVTKAPVPGESIAEAAYSAKAGAAGKDLGKPGKNFSKIANKVGGLKGKRVAGAILAKIRAKHMKEEQIEEVVSAAELSKSGLSLGQYMNKQRGLTAVKGGRNDPTSSNFAGSKPSTPSTSTQWKSPSEPSQSDTIKASGAVPDTPKSAPLPNMASGSSSPKTGAGSGVSSLPGASSSASMSSAPSTSFKNGGSMNVDPGSQENAKRRSGAALEESVQVGENRYRIV